MIGIDGAPAVEMCGSDPKWQELYLEILMGVESKFPNESRHETALRYIRESEQRHSEFWACADASTRAPGISAEEEYSNRCAEEGRTAIDPDEPYREWRE